MQENETKFSEANHGFPISLNIECHSTGRLYKALKYIFVSLCGFSTVIGLLLYAVTWTALNPPRQHNVAIPSQYGLQYTNVTFYSNIDHIPLKGWWIPSQNNKSMKTVIFSHAFGYARTGMPFDSLSLAKVFSFNGYNVLMYDFRNSGESGGKLSTAGYLEQRDLKAAIRFAEEKGTNSIALMGWSMGAVTSIMVGAESEPVRAVIADSPYADFTNYVQHKFPDWLGLPREFEPLMLKAVSLLSGLEPKELSPIRVLKGMDKGLLLIHGYSDGAINIRHSQKLYETANHETTLFWKTQAGHIRSYNWFEETYEQKVLDFLDEYMQF